MYIAYDVRKKMYRKELILVCLVFISIFILPLYANIIDKDLYYPTDQALRDLAVEKKVVPSEPSEEYMRIILEEKKTVCFWVLSSRPKKVSLIKNIKKGFLTSYNTRIDNPDEYYVNQINNVLWNSFNGDEYFSMQKKGIGIIFRTIAIQEGDWDTGDGRSNVQILKDELGDRFEWYKQTYPDKLKALE